jgi:hypothetical protein
MQNEIPVEVQQQLVDTLCEVFYWKKSLRNFLANMGIPRPVLDVVYVKLHSNSKYPVLYDLIERLLGLPIDQGVPPLNKMLRQLSQWTNFAAATNPAQAQKAVSQLARLIRKHNLDLNYSRQAQEAQSGHLRRFTVLRDKYIALSNSTENPQQRGRDFELLLYELFELEELNPSGPFPLDGEQIDGAFELGDTHYLVEAKWKQEKVGPDKVAWFKEKLERRFSGTKGLMISINGFTDGAIRTAGDSKSIILMDGYDLYCVLDPQVDLSLKVLLLGKVAAFAKRGVAFVSAKEFLN